MAGVAFVTGGKGFAGGHLIDALQARGDEVVAPSSRKLDLRDARATREAVASAQPQRVFHLAALASVGRSWDEPQRALVENHEMTLNVLEAVRREAVDAGVLIASSGEIYGPPAKLPVTEDASLKPQSPYAVSKAGTDLLGGMYADAFGLRVVRTRAFNHAGPRQSDSYVIGTLTRQIAEAEAAARQDVGLRTGNPDSRRDFTDVRDVAAAYLAAVELEPGAYNVASERAVSVRELVEAAAALTELDVTHEVDSERVRAHDVAEVRGSARKLREASGWEPQLPLDQTIADALAHWRLALAGERR